MNLSRFSLFSAAPSEVKTLAICLGLAAFTEFALIFMLSAHQQAHVAGHGLPTPVNQTQFIDAEIVDIPPPAKLFRKQAAPPPKIVVTEKAISVKPAEGREASAKEKEAATDPKANVLEATPPGGTALPANHGPIPLVNPAPTLPDYLKSETLNASVVIEFLVTATGGVTPRLLSSSGNEEVDAIALRTARQWQFRPGEKDGQAIASRVRLRIEFEVK